MAEGLLEQRMGVCSVIAVSLGEVGDRGTTVLAVDSELSDVAGHWSTVKQDRFSSPMGDSTHSGARRTSCGGTPSQDEELMTALITQGQPADARSHGYEDHRHNA